LISWIVAREVWKA